MGPYDRRNAGRAPEHPADFFSTSEYAADGSAIKDSHGKIERSAAAEDAFKREHPCPATGKNSAGCPGYVIDHVNPLECGGADAPLNMQWQTVPEGKLKDKTERHCH